MSDVLAEPSPTAVSLRIWVHHAARETSVDVLNAVRALVAQVVTGRAMMIREAIDQCLTPPVLLTCCTLAFTLCLRRAPLSDHARLGTRD